MIETTDPTGEMRKEGLDGGGGGAISVQELGDSSIELTIEDRELKQTVNDARDMQRMGRSQELVRGLHTFSSISFTAVATAGWELTMFFMGPSLMNGGKPSLLWGYVWNSVLFLPIILSLAEMSSIAPIAGAQYHWVSEFAPVKWQKGLSFYTGWMSTLAYQAGNAQGIFLSGTLVQTIILLNNDTYPMPRWHGSLFSITLTIILLLAVTLGARFMPRLQNLFFAGHVIIYLLVLIPIWIATPRSDATDVFLNFQNLGGWPNLTMAVFVGQLTGISAGPGTDTAAHMSEETEDASRNVPLAMLSVYTINFCLCFPLLVGLCFGIDDLEAALSDSTTYPAIYVLRRSMSHDSLIALLSFICLILTVGNAGYLVATSRDLYAFARDNGVPYSQWLSAVDKKRHVPANAIIFSCIVTILLSLIYIGNSTAVYALVSLFIVAIMQCYMFSIGAMLWRRIKKPHTIPPSRWSLGRAGIPLNIIALVYSVWGFFWVLWPTSYPTTAETFNWASVLFGGVSLICGFVYIFKKNSYHGPVTLVAGRTDVAIQ